MKSGNKSEKARRFEVRIEGLTARAEGWGWSGQHQVRIPGALPGERVIAEYHPGRPPADRVRLLEVLEPSPQRVEPPCPYFRTCGGCQLQHLGYNDQLSFKSAILKELAAGIDAFPAPEPVYPAPQSENYRCKTQMPFGESKTGAVLGLFRQGTHQLQPIDYCRVESPEANTALNAVRQWARHQGLPVYDEQTRRGLLRHLLVRKTAGGVMVVVVATSPALPAADLLTETLRAALPTLKSLYLHYNDGAGNAVLGGEDKLLWGAPFIEEDLAGLRFRIFPGTFFQVNPGQMTRILDILDPLLDLRESDLLVDLYCGVGAIALRLASRVREVIGVEFNPDAVSGARENARLNGIQNAAFEVGDAGTVFTGLLSGGKNPDVVVLDPPRKGLEAGVLQALLSAMPRQIAYLSCNPQTLLRDLQQLCAGGFRISRVLPFDMFPQTYHLETLAILEKS